MNKVQNRTNEICLGIAVVLLYFLASMMNTPIIQFLRVNEMPNILRIIWSIDYEIVLLGIIILLLNKKITNDFNDMKKNHQKYFKENFKYYLIGLFVMFASNLINIYVLSNGVATNESNIRELLKINPIYIFITGVMIAPLLEELVFRQGFRNIFKNKYIFILVSGLLFGSLHVLPSMQSAIDLLYLMPYCSLGLAFAYILYKTDNIFVTVALHFMHNGLLISLQIFILLFGVI